MSARDTVPGLGHERKVAFVTGGGTGIGCGAA